MAETVAVPLWAFVLGVLVIVWTMVARLLVPGVRWVMRRRLRRVVGELNTRLQFQISAFKLTRRQALIDRLVSDAKVLAAVDAEALGTGQPKDALLARVERIAREIVPAFNAYAYFRVANFLARRITHLLYRIRLGFADDKGLAAVEPGATVVFVMNHRSNADYLIVAFMAARRTALSYAVGEWAKVWPIQTLVRSLGAYFVRRNSRDPLYRRVLARYVQMATQSGVVQAVYPEGGLSRDGRLRPMKLGLISYMASAFDPLGPRDLVFVPVGINYDRVIEDRTLLRELGPECDEPSAGLVAETLIRAVVSHLGLMLRRRWYRLGYAVVNFGSPISMRAYCKKRGLDFRDMAKPTRMEQVALLGDRIQNAIASTIPAVPVAVVSTVFVANPDRTLSMLEVKSMAQSLIVRLESSGAYVHVARSDRDYAVTVGLRMLVLRHFVTVERGLYRACPSELEILRYYANSIGHFLEGDGHSTTSSQTDG